MKAPKTLLPFIFLSLLHLIGHAAGQETIHMGTKPLLIPALAFYFWKTCIPTPLNKFVYGALFFSWLGDSLLIFSELDGLFFIGGLVTFLLAHIVYVIMNINFVNDGLSKIVFRWPSVIIVIYGLIVFSLLKPNLAELTIPVAIYISVICMMGITAFGRSGRSRDNDFRWVMAGAILFMASDSILAFNKFNAPIANASIWVMTTYLAAQLLLVKGYKEFINGLKASNS